MPYEVKIELFKQKQVILYLLLLEVPDFLKFQFNLSKYISYY